MVEAHSLSPILPDRQDLQEARSAYLASRRVVRSPYKSMIQTAIHIFGDAPLSYTKLETARQEYETIRDGILLNPQEKLREQQILEATDTPKYPSRAVLFLNNHTKLRGAVGLGLTGGILVSAATGFLPVTGGLLVARGALQAYGIAGGIKELEKQIEKKRQQQNIDLTDNRAVDNKLRQDRNATLKRTSLALGIAAVSGSLSLLHTTSTPKFYQFTGKDRLFGDKSSLTGFAQGEYAQKITGHVLHPFDYHSQRAYEMKLTKLFGKDWQHATGYKTAIAGYVNNLQHMNGMTSDFISHTVRLRIG